MVRISALAQKKKSPPCYRGDLTDRPLGPILRAVSNPARRYDYRDRMSSHSYAARCSRGGDKESGLNLQATPEARPERISASGGLGDGRELAPAPKSSTVVTRILGLSEYSPLRSA